ncbi:MAG TPA: tetratricopeptide repeat protein [Verrucomicrobiae bacterium]|nr:tetratricopeptide repeat protein [Verrucomicrobiae bacterium]
MKTYVTGTILAICLCATGAMAQSSTSDDGASGAAIFSQPDQAKRAEAYADFMIGHLAERQFETTGKPEEAQQAVEYYKKALAIDSDASITERLAEVYAAMERTSDAIRAAKQALEQDADNLAAHRLLAHIYIRQLGNASSETNQSDVITAAVEQLQAVERLDGSDLESQLWLAHLYGFENKPELAEQELKKILTHSPANPGALGQLSQLYLDEGHPEQAIALLKDAVASSQDADLYDLLGDAYAKTHDNAKAEAAYEQAVKMDPDEASHRKGLAQAYLSDENYEKALAQYEKLSQMEPDNAENYLRISQIYRHMNQLDKSQTALEQAKKYAPDNVEVLYNEALLDEAQARYKDAIQVLSDTIAGIKAQQAAGQPGPSALAILYEQLGMAHRGAGDYASAERTFEQMQELGPASKRRGELLLIDTYRASGDIKAALAEAQKARSTSGSDESLGVTYAMLLGDNNQTEDAARVLRGLSGQSKRDTYLDLAQVEERGKRYSEAEKDASKALELSKDSGDQESASFMLGAIYDDQKRYNEAEKMFRKSLELNPHDAMVLNYYGYMLADRGIRLDEAISLIHKAVDEDPTNGAYLDSLGWAYFKQGNIPEAEKYLQQAVAHDGDDPTILGHLGDVYAKTGQSERAEQVWQKALQRWQKALPADYKPEKVAELHSKLKNLKNRVAQRSSSAVNPR